MKTIRDIRRGFWIEYRGVFGVTKRRTCYPGDPKTRFYNRPTVEAFAQYLARLEREKTISPKLAARAYL